MCLLSLTALPALLRSDWNSGCCGGCFRGPGSTRWTQTWCTRFPCREPDTLRFLERAKGALRRSAEHRAAARAAIDRAGLSAECDEGRADGADGLLGPAIAWAADLRTSDSYAGILRKRARSGARGRRENQPGNLYGPCRLPEVAVQLEQQLEAAGFVVEQDVREYQFIEADALAGAFDAFILSRATVLDSGDRGLHGQ